VASTMTCRLNFEACVEFGIFIPPLVPFKPAQPALKPATR
jgi:hypothetical protein